MIRNCAHPSCRTSLDECPIECPHGLPFCEHCTWEDGCDECQVSHLRLVADRAWDAAAKPQPWVDPHKDSAADAAAEEHKERDAYELAHLEYREGIA